MGLSKYAPFDPVVVARSAQTRDHGVHQEIEENAQAGDAVQNVGVPFGPPTSSADPSPEPEPVVVPIDFGHAGLLQFDNENSSIPQRAAPRQKRLRQPAAATLNICVPPVSTS
jgi:hypothetical protein